MFWWRLYATRRTSRVPVFKNNLDAHGYLAYITCLDKLINTRLLPYLKVLFTVTAWGLSFIATKIALSQVEPLTLVWVRFTMGVVLMGVAAGLRGNLVLPNRKAMLNFTLLGFLGITFHQLLQSHALLTSRASTTAWIIAATPVFIAILSYLVLNEKISIIQLAGIVMATIGVVLVISNGDVRALFSGGIGSPGDILIIISALNWAVFTVLSRPWLQRYSPAQMMFYVMLSGWLFLTILFIASPPSTKIGQLSTQTWLALAFLGIICSGFAYIFWYDALQAIQASQVGVFLNIEPLVTTVAAALILDEPITIISITGGLVILFGVWLVNQPNEINWLAFLKSARRKNR